MKWEDGRESDNVDDRRGEGGGGFGGLPGIPIGGRSIGIGTVVIALAASYFFGIDPSVILGLAGGVAPTQVAQSNRPLHRPPEDDRTAKFVSVVLADTEDAWTQTFAKNGQTYRKPSLVLFSGATGTACGQGQTASGPFYCPGDEKVYIDLDFFQMMQTRFHAAGDFAQAYVIAHEVGHHVQKLLGISDKMESLRRRASEAQYNQASVRLELQADCFAGVWAYRLKSDQSAIKLDSGDIEEALNAASAIGDDTLQKQATGHVVPESFTHGTSAQRVRWFKQGADSGDMTQCNTFSTSNL